MSLVKLSKVLRLLYCQIAPCAVLSCDTCNLWYHLECSGLDNKEFLEHVNNKTLRWSKVFSVSMW